MPFPVVILGGVFLLLIVVFIVAALFSLLSPFLDFTENFIKAAGATLMAIILYAWVSTRKKL